MASDAPIATMRVGYTAGAASGRVALGGALIFPGFSTVPEPTNANVYASGKLPADAKRNQPMPRPKDAPNCYDCKHRGMVPGSAHSQCGHPDAPTTEGSGMLGMLSLFGKIGPLPIPQTKLNVLGNAHGRRSGWFNWPFNFDPVWLERCEGFEACPPHSERERTDRET